MERKERERDWKPEELTNREREEGNRLASSSFLRKKEGRRRKKNQGANDTLGKTERFRGAVEFSADLKKDFTTSVPLRGERSRSTRRSRSLLPREFA